MSMHFDILPLPETQNEPSTTEPPFQPATPLYPPPPGSPFRPGTPIISYQPLTPVAPAPVPIPVMATMPHSNGKEIWINNPTEFDGNREQLNLFLQDCHLYLALNSEIYNEDDKNIIFILSYMTKGTAKAWKEAFVRNLPRKPNLWIVQRIP